MAIDENWWEIPPTFPNYDRWWETPTTPINPAYPTYPTYPPAFPVYTDQPVKCPQCGVWWRGTEHSCNLNYHTYTTTNTVMVNSGESTKDLSDRIEKSLKKRKKKKKVDKKRPPDIVFK